MDTRQQKEFLIVGQGIAGSLLAWHLQQAGHAAIVVDQNHHESSSIISAGILNPITGQRLALTPRFEFLSTIAMQTYSEIGAQLNGKFFISKPVLRILRSVDEHARALHLNTVAAAKPYITDINPPGTLGGGIKDPFGTLPIARGGYLQIQRLLSSLREYFIRNGMLIQEHLDYRDVQLTENAVRWKRRSFAGIIFCEGFKAGQNPWFKGLPYAFVKGEILRIAFDASPLPDAILCQRQWCVPSEDGTYLAGSTYDRANINTFPTQEGKSEILEGLDNMIAAKLKVLDHYAAVRPVMINQRPVLQTHPSAPRLAIFNGLGSKGVLWAPYYAQQLTELLDSACKQHLQT